jgi:hypothetical protein
MRRPKHSSRIEKSILDANAECVATYFGRS